MGPTLPDLQQIANVALDTASWIHTVVYFGYMVGCCVSGPAFKRIHPRYLLPTSLFGVAMSTTLTPWGRVFGLIITCSTCTGVFLGLIDTGYPGDAKTYNEIRRERLGLVERSIDTLPPNIRSAIANALTARGRDPGILGKGDIPEVVPIVGGRDAPDFKYPWFARVFYFWNDNRPYYLFCGGSVCNKRTIITAAHCVVDPEQVDGYYVIHAGQFDLLEREGLEQITMVDKIIQHPGFHYSGTFIAVDDVALVITDVPLNFTTIAVKPLPSLSTKGKDEMALKSNNCVAIGYGIFVHRPGRRFPDNLQESIPVSLVFNKDCHQSMWRRWDLSLTPRMICSMTHGAKPGAFACSGDSGGPIGCYDNDGVYYQVGVFSWISSKNQMCIGESVYMRISEYRRWIKYFSHQE